jgi:hypothetical protein
MIFPFSSLSLIRSKNRKNPPIRMAVEPGNSYLLTTPGADCSPTDEFAGAGLAGPAAFMSRLAKCLKLGVAYSGCDAF